MPLAVTQFYTSTTTNIYTAFQTLGDVQATAPVRFGLVLFLKELGSAAGNITVRATLIDIGTSMIYSVFEKTVAKGITGDAAAVIDPGWQIYLPLNTKAEIKIKSDHVQDTGVTWEGWAYDLNYPTADAATRLSQNRSRMNKLAHPSGTKVEFEFAEVIDRN